MHLFYKIAALFLLCPLTTLWAQNTFSYHGIVKNTEGEPLAFVAILPNDDVTKGVLSDIEGRFTITSKTPIQSLTFRCIGSQTLRLDADFLKKNTTNRPLPDGIGISFRNSIILKNADNLISEVTILAGENPANRIVRLVIANKNKNNPEKLATFQCKTYNKVAFDLVPNDTAYVHFLSKRDTSKKRIQNLKENFEKSSAQSTDRQAFLMETVTERRFRFPNDNFERVILNRVSGFPNAGMVALANMIQPFSFYGDFLRVLDKNYVNPVSIGSLNQYFFNIEDTLYQGIDTVFILSFHPQKGKVFEGLTGVLHINSRQWALQNVRAKPATPSVSTLKIEQQYRFDTTAAQWFPDQLNFELPKYPLPFLGTRIVGRSYISDVSINPPLQQKDFNPEAPLIIEKNAFGQADSAWLPFREVAPLSIRELRTYDWMDSMSRKNHFDFWAKALNAVTSGKLPIKKSDISLDLTRLFRTNNYENVRLGLGLTNAPAAAFSRPKFWESSIYAGYGLLDSAWKYGGNIKFRLSQGWQTSVQLSYIHDIREPGTLSELDPTGFVSRSLYANRFDTNDELAAAFSSRLGKRIFVKIIGQQQFLQPNYAYSFEKNKGEVASNFHFTEFSAYLKYVFNEQNPSFLGETINEINKIPVIEVGYTRGFDGLLRGDYAYDKWLFSLHQTTMIRRLGRLIWRVEGGLVKENVPLAKLFTLNQSGSSGLFYIYVPNTFQTFGDTATWLSDRFLNVYVAQSFGNVLYRSKWSSPQLSIAQNMALGQLSNPEFHQGITFSTPTKPLIESGLILDNLLKINYLNFGNLGLGVAVFYRWGTDVTSWRSFNPRMSLRFSL
jgi:Family of unknown function (DUF5686)